MLLLVQQHMFNTYLISDLKKKKKNATANILQNYLNTSFANRTFRKFSYHTKILIKTGFYIDKVLFAKITRKKHCIYLYQYYYNYIMHLHEFRYNTLL